MSSMRISLRSILIGVTVLLVLGLTARDVLAVNKANPFEGQSTEQIVAALREIEDVAGVAVGNSGTPGEFYNASTVLLAQASEAEFRAMLKDQKPSVRVMGLYGLARTQGQKAIEPIKAHLDDAESIRLNRFGCVGFEDTVGTIALFLLHEPDFFHRNTDFRPLLSRSQLFALDVSRIASDDIHEKHSEATKFLLGEIFRCGLVLPSLDWIRKECPDLSLVVAAKGIGRLEPQAGTRMCLIEIMNAKDVPAEARYAAGSALTRDHSPVAVEALRSAKASLDELSGEQKLGSRFVAEVERRSHLVSQNLLPGTRDNLYPPPDIDMMRVYAEAAWQPHPMLIQEALWPYTGYSQEEAESPTRGVAILSFIQLLDNTTQPWNTYSNIEPRMADLLLKNEKYLRKDLGDEVYEKARDTLTQRLNRTKAATRPSR